MIELKESDRMLNSIRDEMIRQGAIDIWDEFIFDLDSVYSVIHILEAQVWIAVWETK